ncbi:MAG: tetratricopeptide repeat protein [Tabrizicola sp.]|uniref:tetratricopeptide repeat protein n=1 Tax=Tabrizicola sp. TaxID=2005166 RepID=UPI001B780299|nr:tetratricopeptide repeat protein [Tabrizicola sp.]MCC6519016.1 tetratricopeptide repeat protein [Tabrizicola sp.]
MSNPDSFIDEVTEEVRRDRLFRLFRKYGWIGVVIILGLVIGTAWTEWSKSRAEARAEAFGDAVIDALDHGTPDERREALAAVPAETGQSAILGLIMASDPVEDKAATLAALDKVAADASLTPAYRDLAVLRRVLVAGADLPVADRRSALEGIAAPGRPYRVLAEEQLGYLLIEEGKPDDAIAALTALLQDQEASASLRARLGQVVTALGGTVPEVSGG